MPRRLKYEAKQIVYGNCEKQSRQSVIGDMDDYLVKVDFSLFN